MVEDKIPKAEVIRQALMELRAEDGSLSPDVVEAAAKDPESPLHHYFEWDDSVAGRAYRLQQAARLIRTVKIEVIVESKKVVTPLYVNSPKSSEVGRYLPVTTVRDDAVMAHGVLLDELSRIESAIRRARALASVLDFEPEFEQMLNAAASIKERVKAEESRFKSTMENAAPMHV